MKRYPEGARYLEGQLMEEELMTRLRPRYKNLGDWLKETNASEHISSQRTRLMLELYYGLHPVELTLWEIGNRFGISRERVRQLLKKATEEMQSAHGDLPLGFGK